MTTDQFNNVVSVQMELCADTLAAKGAEYTPETNSNDRLAHFKKAAVIMNTTPKAALLGMLSKHIVSVSDMCMANEGQPVERWNEKITDSINYLLILRALVEEEQNGQN